MCSPEASLGMQTSGAINQTVGSYYNAKAQKVALKGQAGLDEINARLSDISARSALTAGEREEQKQKMFASRLKDSQSTGFAANGVDLSSESVVNVLSTTDVLGEIDANTVKANAFRSAWGYRTEAVSYRNKALTGRASADMISPFMQAGTTLLTAASPIARNRYLLNKYGEF